MIDFKPITLEQKAVLDPCLHDGEERGCEFSFANLFLWGRQKAAFVDGQLVLFSQFSRRSVYPFPAGLGDRKVAVDAIIQDAAERGIPCRITGLADAEMEWLEQQYPGAFRYHCDRDSYDYVYAIEDLAELKGRKYQRKRNHINRFREAWPEYYTQPLTDALLPAVQALSERWYEARIAEDPTTDYLMERAALNKALRCYKELELEGLVLLSGEDVLAFTLGSRLAVDTMDVHFEKTDPRVPEAYPVINWLFARHIREKFPQVQFLNREDDMGIEGLRKAKESYYPHHMVKKCWACLLEDGYDY